MVFGSILCGMEQWYENTFKQTIISQQVGLQHLRVSHAMKGESFKAAP